MIECWDAASKRSGIVAWVARVGVRLSRGVIFMRKDSPPPFIAAMGGAAAQGRCGVLVGSCLLTWKIVRRILCEREFVPYVV
jgi:hypothetical protein